MSKRSEWIGEKLKNEKYKILRLIACGAFGQVFLGEDLRMKGNKK